MVLQTHKSLKGKVRLTVSSTLPIQQAYSISCSKAEKEIDLLEDGGKRKEHRSPLLENYSDHLPPSRPAYFLNGSYL
jgi:hypothetical protein